MDQLFMGLGIFGVCAGVLCIAFGLLYVFGGKKIREQLRSEW